jgi:hypothetical protein
VYLSVASTAGLRQGLFAQGTLGTAKVQTLSVPLSAVRNDKPSPYVQVLQNDAISHQSVELGSRGDALGTTMVAVKNISAGTKVTLASAGFIRDGTKVKITLPANLASKATAAPASAAANN